MPRRSARLAVRKRAAVEKTKWEQWWWRTRNRRKVALPPQPLTGPVSVTPFPQCRGLQSPQLPDRGHVQGLCCAEGMEDDAELCADTLSADQSGPWSSAVSLTAYAASVLSEPPSPVETVKRKSPQGHGYVSHSGACSIAVSAASQQESPSQSSDVLHMPGASPVKKLKRKSPQGHSYLPCSSAFSTAASESQLERSLQQIGDLPHQSATRAARDTEGFSAGGSNPLPPASAVLSPRGQAHSPGSQGCSPRGESCSLWGHGRSPLGQGHSPRVPPEGSRTPVVVMQKLPWFCQLGSPVSVSSLSRMNSPVESPRHADLPLLQACGEKSGEEGGQVPFYHTSDSSYPSCGDGDRLPPGDTLDGNYLYFEIGKSPGTYSTPQTSGTNAGTTQGMWYPTPETSARGKADAPDPALTCSFTGCLLLTSLELAANEGIDDVCYDTMLEACAHMTGVCQGMPCVGTTSGDAFNENASNKTTIYAHTADEPCGSADILPLDSWGQTGSAVETVTSLDQISSVAGPVTLGSTGQQPASDMARQEPFVSASYSAANQSTDTKKKRKRGRPPKDPSGGSTAKRSSGGSTAKPSSGGSTAKRSSGGSTAKPSSGGSTAKPPSGGSTAKPSSGGSTAKPPSGGSTAKPSSGESTAKPPSGGSTAKPPSGGSTAKPPSGGSTAKPPSGGSTAKPPSDGSTAKPSSGGPGRKRCPQSAVSQAGRGGGGVKGSMPEMTTSMTTKKKRSVKCRHCSHRCEDRAMNDLHVASCHPHGCSGCQRRFSSPVRPFLFVRSA
ncbi:hypothetical protein ACOMHN_017951 [Nucella lapillus]